MREKIIKFRKKPLEKTLVIKHDTNENILYNWTKVNNFFIISYNQLILSISGILPLKLKNFTYSKLLNISVGKNTAISPGVEFDPFYPQLVSFGDNVIVGWKVIFLSHEFKQSEFKFGKIIIKDNVLIGAFSRVKGGVTIGKNSIIAMNSFVNKDIPENEIWGGVPAKFIKKNN